MLTSSFATKGFVARVVALGLILVVSVAVPPNVAAQQASSPSALVKPDVPPDYVIGPGDILQIFVWKEPDVSREVRVRTDGKVTIPLVGDVAAAGATTQALGEGLAQKLKQYLNAPKVTVSLLASSSLRFFVVGEVNKPGEFLFGGRVTVLEALALAGGFKEEAKRDKIVIIRRDPNGQGGAAAAATRRPGDTIIRVNYKNLATGRDLRGNALLQPGDTVVVP
ncbi:MAG TPA: polysaccharide biosynthesis/export family protein [Vicinamibacteria bacterium]|nr:polysaccharide biosynthesis/export family protein [Vicinamibacteria bacterium]